MELHLLNFGSGKHFRIMFSVSERPGKLIVQKMSLSVKQEKKKVVRTLMLERDHANTPPCIS